MANEQTLDNEARNAPVPVVLVGQRKRHYPVVFQHIRKVISGATVISLAPYLAMAESVRLKNLDGIINALTTVIYVGDNRIATDIRAYGDAIPSGGSITYTGPYDHEIILCAVADLTHTCTLEIIVERAVDPTV